METTTAQLQEFIFEGRRVLIKHENKNVSVRVRFNKDFTEPKDKWRIFVDNAMFFCKEIQIDIPVYTKSELCNETNEVKHHVVCDANEVEFKNGNAYVS